MKTSKNDLDYSFVGFLVETFNGRTEIINVYKKYTKMGSVFYEPAYSGRNRSFIFEHGWLAKIKDIEAFSKNKTKEVLYETFEELIQEYPEILNASEYKNSGSTMTGGISACIVTYSGNP